MDLDSLRCFVAVAESLRFREAAARLGRSPAALSDRVAQLEADVGEVLLVRSTRRVALSEAGLRLLPHARSLLEQAARCGAVARGDGRPLPFQLVLGTRFELGLSWLCPALPGLRAARPERTLHLSMGETDALLDGVEASRIDACVLSSPRLRPGLRAVALHEERYAFVGHRGGPACAAEAASARLLDATSDLPLARYLFDALPDGREWRFGEHLYLGGIAAIRALACMGEGVAVLPRYFIEDDLAAGRLVELLPGLPLRTDQFRLIWREQHPADGALRALAAELAALPLR